MIYEDAAHVEVKQGRAVYVFLLREVNEFNCSVHVTRPLL